MAQKQCTHIGLIKEGVKPKTPNGCEECLALGDTWVSLRMCLTCGHIGCCDSSKNKHATKHFKTVGHPIMRGYKTKHRFKWCYIDEMEVELPGKVKIAR
ncbi:MAG: UBP-type zinc finger domain-containing protein [Candidatus Saccharimonadales bacterium]